LILVDSNRSDCVSQLNAILYGRLACNFLSLFFSILCTKWGFFWLLSNVLRFFEVQLSQSRILFSEAYRLIVNTKIADMIKYWALCYLLLNSTINLAYHLIATNRFPVEKKWIDFLFCSRWQFNLLMGWSVVFSNHNPDVKFRFYIYFYL
jgi:hypothetical protein